MAKVKQTYSVPTTLADSYTDTDERLLTEIYGWLNSNAEHTKSWLAQRSGMPEGTLASVLSGKYNASPTGKLKQIQQATVRADERELRGMNERVVVETTVFKLSESMFTTAQVEAELTMVCGFAGIGKTVAAEEFVANNADAIYIRALPEMSATTLLRKLVDISGAIPAGHTKDAKLDAVIEAFAKRDSVILIDEAENMQDECFEDLRVLRDVAKVGICLIGESALSSRLKRKGKFNKLESRLGPNTGIIKHISRKDSDLIVFAHFGDIDKKIADAFWKACGGSARRLEEKIIRKIKSRKLLDKHELSPALIQAVSKQLLRD